MGSQEPIAFTCQFKQKASKVPLIFSFFMIWLYWSVPVQKRTNFPYNCLLSAVLIYNGVQISDYEILLIFSHLQLSVHALPFL